MHFDVTTQGRKIICTITVDTDLICPVFCFSLMAPPQIIAGGILLTHTGGYGEAQLPDLTAGVPHIVTLCYADPALQPANRAWLPLGPYLRHAHGLTALPALPAGVRCQAETSCAPFTGLRLLPQPDTWVPSGTTLKPTGFTWSGCPALDRVAALAKRCNVTTFQASKGIQITVEINPNKNVDSYDLTISATGITLSAADDGGLFYAGITLLTLLQTHPDGIPTGHITDTPRFTWRGQHLDCARHFYAPATILRLLDLMALCKLNRFHWHFADDEAFRIEVDCLPALWQKTAQRGEGHVIPSVFGAGISAGGTYSKADVASIIAHARSLNIEVMPEIEVPAHALAFCKIYPETLDPAETRTQTSVQGYKGNAANPAMPATLTKFKALATEIANLFPFQIIHLGGDELPADTWGSSPAASQFKQAQGLQNTDDLFGWTLAALGKHLHSLGRRPAAWEEAAHGSNGGIGHGALLFSWSGQGPGIAAARAGYDVIMAPAQHAYLDMAHSADAADWGANWAATIAIEDTVNWDPIPQNAADIAGRVIGVEGTFWSEFTTQDAQMEPMLAPRILGIAAKAWEVDPKTDGSALRALAGHYRAVFDQMGWARYKGA